jgi:inhibitor of cysteine peptidase
MNRLLVISCLAVALVAASGARAELCDKCKGQMYIQSIGKCSSCDGFTSSGAFKLCRKCSAKTGKCEHCLAPLAGIKPPAEGEAEKPKPKPIDPRRSGTYSHEKWKYELVVRAPGTRSEGKWGRLSYGGKVLVAEGINDHYQTPWGPIYWVGESKSRYGDHLWMPHVSRREPDAKGKLLDPPGGDGPAKVLTKADSGSTLEVTVGTTIEVQLQGNPTTGYGWRTAKLDGDAVKQMGKPKYQVRPHRPGMVGVGGTYTFRFEAVKAGTTALELHYLRPWEKDKPPAESFAFKVRVKAN